MNVSAISDVKYKPTQKNSKMTSFAGNISPFHLSMALNMSDDLMRLPHPHRIVHNLPVFTKKLAEAADLQFLLTKDHMGGTVFHRACGAFVSQSKNPVYSFELVNEIIAKVASTPLEVELLLAKNRGKELAIKYADAKTKATITSWVLDVINDLKGNSSTLKDNKMALKLLNAYWGYILDYDLHDEIMNTIGRKSILSRVAQNMQSKIAVAKEFVIKRLQKNDIEII